MFSSCHVIHVKNRSDREVYIRSLGKSDIVLSNKTPFFVHQVERQQDGRKGCYESHIEVMKKALKIDNHKPCLIFEDDAIVAPDLSTSAIRLLFDEASKFVASKSNDYDILFLGSFPNMFSTAGTIQTSFQNIYESSPATTHAYIASPNFMKRMTSVFSTFQNVAIDDFYKSTLFKKFAVYPSVFLQATSESDVASASASFVSKSGFKHFLWRFAERYCTSTHVNLKHVFFLLPLVILFIYVASSS